MTVTLSRWLADRSRDELAAILSRRPETLGARHLGEVASRLSVPYGIETVIRGLPKPCIELLETIIVYGGSGVDVDDLASVLGVDADDRLFAAALQVCEWWAIAWVVDGDVHVAPALAAALPRPLRLGPPVADLLAGRTVDDLRTRAAALGLARTARRHDLVAAIAEFYRDADAVRALYDAAPEEQRKRLAEAAWDGPALDYGGSFFYTGRPDPAISWLLTYGLAVADWQQIVVPREVALAIRGDDWHPALTPRPEVATTPGVSTETADEDAAAAAALATEHLALVVDVCEVAPPARLKAGGVGVRDVRRIAKATGLQEPAVRLWLALAADVGFVEIDDDLLLPTAAYDAWLAEPPARRLAVLVDAWWDLRSVPTLVERPGGSTAPPVLADDSYAAIAANLRTDLLAAAAEIPAGSALADGLALAGSVEWRRPATAERLGDVRFVVAALWAEAHLLGIAAHGMLTALGRAALGDLADIATEPLPPVAGLRALEERDRLARVAAEAAEMLPEHSREAIFQADLTVVVAGTPAADVAALLDTSADRESRGGATTWRFSPGSVRRALDAGYTGDSLTEALAAIAGKGSGRLSDDGASRLPQPLLYLIRDAARRHGGIRVRALGCVLRAEDPALLAELVAVRSLARLQLVLLAPNVLGSAGDVTETLQALREAGYAPVGEAVDGQPLIERLAKRRAAHRATVIPIQSRRTRPVHDPYDRAEELLAAPVPAAAVQPVLRLVPNPAATPTRVLVGRYASRLDDAQRDLLSEAIDAAEPVRIAYTSGAGDVSERIIEPIEVAGGLLVAWCRLRDDERKFALARIGSVAPAG